MEIVVSGGQTVCVQTGKTKALSISCAPAAVRPFKPRVPYGGPARHGLCDR